MASCCNSAEQVAGAVELDSYFWPTLLLDGPVETWHTRRLLVVAVCAAEQMSQTSQAHAVSISSHSCTGQQPMHSSVASNFYWILLR